MTRFQLAGPRGGIALVELLMGLGLAVVLIGAVLGFLARSTRGSQDLALRARLQQSARFLETRIRQDLAHAIRTGDPGRDRHQLALKVLTPGSSLRTENVVYRLEPGTGSPRHLTRNGRRLGDWKCRDFCVEQVDRRHSIYRVDFVLVGPSSRRQGGQLTARVSILEAWNMF